MNCHELNPCAKVVYIFRMCNMYIDTNIVEIRLPYTFQKAANRINETKRCNLF